MMSQKKFPEKSSKIKESPETYLSLRVSRQLKVSRVYSLTQIPVNPLGGLSLRHHCLFIVN